MSSWHSYGSIYNVGHRAAQPLLEGPVVVEEKVDGSQFSFGVFNGELRVRSKGQELTVDAPEKMFAKAVETAKRLAPELRDGWTYRGEYLQKPKHNALAYDTIPLQHVILFDIAVGEEDYLSWDAKATEATRLGLQCVAKLHEGVITADLLRGLLGTVSILGGQTIEGVVLKPIPGREVYGPDKKRLAAKFVSEAFKEVHAKSWKQDHPKSGDILVQLADAYTTPARWNKAIVHLKESGQIEGSPRDIGALMKEVPRDVVAECEEEIKDRLWAWAKPHVTRAVTRGLPEFYKQRLLDSAFEEAA